MKLVKNIVTIALFCILILIHQSCTDTFGTDPNVKITELNPLPPEGKDTSKAPVEMDNLWNFVEYFSIGNKGSSMTWGNNHRFLRNKFVVDTSKEETILWMDIEAICTIPDEAIRNRNDRILSMRLTIDSLAVPRSRIEQALEPRKASLVRVELVIKDFRNNKKYVINEKELGIIFSIHQETKKSQIRGFLNADLSEYSFLNTFNFQAIFEADFK